MFELVTYLEFFTFVVGLSIAIYVFAKNPKSSLNLALATTALGMAGWNISVFLIINELIPLDFGVQNSFAWAALMSMGFTWFVYRYPTKIKWYKVLTPIIIALGILFFLIPFHPDFAFNTRVPNGYVEVDFHTILYPLWTLFFVGNFLYTLAILIGRTWKATGVDKHRLIQILLGFLLFLIPSQMSNLLLPYLFNDFRWNNLGPLFTIFLIFFLFNAVTRYRLLEIKWIFGKSLIFSVLTGAVLWLIITTAILLSSVAPERVTIIFSAFLVVVFYNPLSKFFHKVFKRLLSRGGYDAEDATQEILSILRADGDLEIIVKNISSKLQKFLNTSEISFIVFHTDSNRVLFEKNVGIKKLQKTDLGELVSMAKDNDFNIIELEELKWKAAYGKTKSRKCKKMCKLLERTKIDIVVPLVIEKKIVGLVNIGHRKMDKALSNRDFRFLDTIQDIISPAIENAAKFAQINDLYDQLKETDQAKSEFIRVVSHRFRTPLSAIRWNLEAVLDSSRQDLPKDTLESLEDTQNRTLFLIDTLDRLFDSLSIESKSLKLDVKTFSLSKALEPILKKFTKTCFNKNIFCKYELPDIKMEGDERRILSMCNSFLSNALQYTSEDGKVIFKIEKVKGEVRIIVSDTGIGIPEEAMEKIFDKFYRAKNAVLTYTDGQGLGLYFVKEIVRLHKGKIVVSSKKGEGTMFTVTLPIKRKKTALKKKK